METAVVVQPSEMNWLERIVEKGVTDPSALEKIVEMKYKMMDRLARAEFATAMNACQKEMPRVVKDADNPHAKSRYVLLETLKDAITPIFLKHGFSLTWGQADCPIADHTRVICDLYHVSGYSQRYQGDYPIDGKGAKGGGVMNALQGTVSAHSYAQRDMLRLMFDVTIAGKDLDGVPTVQYATTEEIARINTAWDECDKIGCKLNWERFLHYLAVDGLENLDSAGVDKAIKFLRAKYAAAVKARDA